MRLNWHLRFLWLLPVWYLTLLLVGCTNHPQEFMVKNKLQIAEQLPDSHVEQETMLTYISQVLLVGNITQKERAALHYERGVMYDSFGLWTLARYDFLQSLSFQPKVAAPYNYLGIYQLLNEEYEDALEIFNIALGLNPKDEYSLLNRGLGLYYMGRYQLAEKDLLQSYQIDQTDPYRALWLYLNELKINPENAKQQLAQRSKMLSNKQWGSYIVQYYLGQLSAEELLQKGLTFSEQNSISYAEVLTETYFYLAKQQLNLGQTEKAENLLKLTLANQVYNFVEYRFAVLELAKLKRQQAQ